MFTERESNEHGCLAKSEPPCPDADCTGVCSGADRLQQPPFAVGANADQSTPVTVTPVTDSALATSSDSRVFNLNMPGTATMYLAGRDDVTIPPVDADDVALPLLRCGGRFAGNVCARDAGFPSRWIRNLVQCPRSGFGAGLFHWEWLDRERNPSQQPRRHAQPDQHQHRADDELQGAEGDFLDQAHPDKCAHKSRQRGSQH